MDLQSLSQSFHLVQSSQVSAVKFRTASTDKSRISASVYHRDKDGLLYPFDSRISLLILEAFRKGDAHIVIGRGKGALEFDMRAMKQLPHGRKKEERDIVIETVWSAQSFLDWKSLKLEDGLRRKILTMALDYYKEQKSIFDVLNWKKVPYLTVRVNPYLAPGHLPYENFIDSLMTVPCPQEVSLAGKEFSKDCSLYGGILRAVSDGFTDMNLYDLQNLGLHFLFHGTNQDVMDSILETGLLPTFRISGFRDRDWFGVDYTVSLNFSQAKTKRKRAEFASDKVLLFLVLNPDNEGYPMGYPVAAKTSKSNQYQLPLAEVFLE